MTTLRLRQSTCVALGQHAILIEGPPGAGKSTLALALIDRGAALVGDDGVAIELRGGHLWAAPAPATRGLIEVRNLGLIEFPAVEARVALHLDLDPRAPRFVEQAGDIEIDGERIPSLAFDPAIPAAPLRAEIALRTFGLSWRATAPS